MGALSELIAYINTVRSRVVYNVTIPPGPPPRFILEAVGILGLMGSYQHHWSDEYRSTIGYAWADGDVPAGAPATATEELTYGFVNLIWQFCDRAWTGLEWLHGSRRTFDDEEGDADRLQFALRFDL